MKSVINKENKEKILKTNPKINRDLVENVERLEAQLKKVGIEIKTRYSLSPPLGEGLLHLYNRSSVDV